jgi:serine/threonine-protein kinase RsbW
MIDRRVADSPPPPARRESQTFRNRDEELRRMSDWFRRFAAESGFSEQKALDLELCLNEVLTNINHYAHQDSDAEREIRVALSHEGCRLEAAIEDDGQPFNPVEASAPANPGSLEEARVGGWGIPIVRALADEVRYERRDGRNRLVIVSIDPTVS